MARRRLSRGTSLAVALLLAACDHRDRSYRGDGVLIDHGWLSGGRRYELDLGAVDLTRSARRQFTMMNLPPERLAVGFEILPASPSDELSEDRRLPFDPVVLLRVASSSRVLIEYRHPLNEWILNTVGSTSYPVFAYCGGDADHWDELPGTAWGCVFKPAPGERYTATWEIVQPDGAAARRRVRFLIRGGGYDWP